MMRHTHNTESKARNSTVFLAEVQFFTMVDLEKRSFEVAGHVISFLLG